MSSAAALGAAEVVQVQGPDHGTTEVEVSRQGRLARYLRRVIERNPLQTASGPRTHAAQGIALY